MNRVRAGLALWVCFGWTLIAGAGEQAAYTRPAPDSTPASAPAETPSGTVAPPARAAAQPARAEPVMTGGTGVLIPITGDINDVTTESLQRRVDAAIERGARLVVFELNTPGGYVTSALDICDHIKNLTQVKTVAWVHSQAYSAGSMIAVACDEIVMASASTLGDCGVILGTPMGPQAVPEELKAKAESPVLEQFRDSAARRGYDRLLAESFVRFGREVWWLENTETGKREFVDDATKRQRLGESEGGVAKSLLDRAFAGSVKPAGPWKLVETYIDPLTGKETPFDQPVVREKELLTLSQSRAYALGFCKAIVSDEPDLVERYGLTGPLERIDFTWSENLVSWLTSMPVRGFLLVLILLGAYVEFNTPGVGVAGLVALIGLAIFVGAPYLTGLANVWEIVVLLLGVALILVEIFVIPGFGVAGISGLVLVLVGLLATFIPEEPGRTFPLYWPSMPSALEGLKLGVITLASAMAVSVVGMVLFSRYLPQMPYLHRLVPENPTPVTVAPEDPYQGMAQVGDLGTCETALRPAGKAKFGGVLVDVVTEGEFVDPGSEVEVVHRLGNHVVVRSVKA